MWLDNLKAPILELMLRYSVKGVGSACLIFKTKLDAHKCALKSRQEMTGKK